MVVSFEFPVFVVVRMTEKQHFLNWIFLFFNLFFLCAPDSSVTVSNEIDVYCIYNSDVVVYWKLYLGTVF